MKNTIVLLFLTLFIQSSYGQLFHRTPNQERLIVLSPGFSAQGNGNFYTELNIMYSKITTGEPYFPPAYHGPRIGMEVNFFNNHHLVYAPKVGWEGSLFFLCVRGNLISYFDKGNVDLRILPEIGLSFKSGINLLYGYNIPLLDYRTGATTNHRLTLTINLDMDLWQTY